MVSCWKFRHFGMALESSAIDAKWYPFKVSNDESLARIRVRGFNFGNQHYQ
jgi:hypothetical protein